ncbi:nucleolar protein dao-5-like isoform X2 [Lineus longissimus]|uniref:nucleolar protein dao-5-like isoform X2 n=1 Tax=Lineus longissimus TaxID=88925 RepID=UPI00315C64CD
MAEFSTPFREFVKTLLIKGCNMKEITLRTLREKYLVHTGRDSFNKLEKLQMKSVVLEELEKFPGSEPTESDDGSAPTSPPETSSYRRTSGSQQSWESPHQGIQVASTTANNSSTRPTSKPKRMSAEQAVNMLQGKGEDNVDSLPVRGMALRSSPRKRTPTRVSPAVRKTSPRVCKAKKRLSSDLIMAEIVNDGSDSEVSCGVDQQEESDGDIDKGCSDEVVTDIGDDEDTDVEGCSQGADQTVDEMEGDVPKSDMDVSNDGSFVEWRPVIKKKKVALESDDTDFEMDGCDTILLSPLGKGSRKLNQSEILLPLSKGKQKKVVGEKADETSKDLVKKSSAEESKTSLKSVDHDKKVPMGYFVGTERKECRIVLQKLNMDSLLSAVSFYKNKSAANSSRVKSDEIVKGMSQFGGHSLETNKMEDDSHSDDTDVGDVTPRKEQLAVRSRKGNSKRKPHRKGVTVGVCGDDSSSSDGEPLSVLVGRNSPGIGAKNSAEHSSSDDESLSVDRLRNGKSPRELVRDRKPSRRKSSRMSAVLNESYAEILSSDSDTDLESVTLKSKQCDPKDPVDETRLGQRSPRKCAVKESYAETLSDEDGKPLKKNFRDKRPRRVSPRKAVTVRQEKVVRDSSSDDFEDITPKKGPMKKMHSKDKKKVFSASDSDTDVQDVTPKKENFVIGSDEGKETRSGQRSPRKCAVKESYAETLSDEDGKPLKKNFSDKRPRRVSPRKAVTVRQEKVVRDSSSDDIEDITPKKGPMKKMHSKDKKKVFSASDSDTDVQDVTPKKENFVIGSDEGKVKDLSPIVSEGNKDKFSESSSDTDIGDVALKWETVAKESESPRKHAPLAKRGQAVLESSSDDEPLSSLRGGKSQRNHPWSPECSLPRKKYFDSSSNESDKLPELTPRKTDLTKYEQDSAEKGVGKSEDYFTLSSDEEILKALVGKSQKKRRPKKIRTPNQSKSQKFKRKAVSSSDSDEEPLRDHSRTTKISPKEVSKKDKKLQESSDLETSIDTSDSEIVPLKSSGQSKNMASFQKATKKDTGGQGGKRKRSQGSSQESGSASGPKKKAAKVDKGGSLEKQYKFLVRVNREAGLFVHYRAMKNMNEGKKIKFLKEALDKAGMKGRPTLEKAEELKLQREVAELNAGNIINIDSGTSKRSSRSRSQTTSSRPAPKPQTPAKKRFSRLSDIIDSEGSSD